MVLIISAVAVPAGIMAWSWMSGGTAAAAATGATATGAAATGVAATGATPGILITSSTVTVAISTTVALVGTDGCTWDCWKQIVHDESKEPTKGIHLDELKSHPLVSSLTIKNGKMLVENIFLEKFELLPVDVPQFGIAFHAVRT